MAAAADGSEIGQHIASAVADFLYGDNNMFVEKEEEEEEDNHDEAEEEAAEKAEVEEAEAEEAEAEEKEEVKEEEEEDLFRHLLREGAAQLAEDGKLQDGREEQQVEEKHGREGAESAMPRNFRRSPEGMEASAWRQHGESAPGSPWMAPPQADDEGDVMERQAHPISVPHDADPHLVRGEELGRILRGRRLPAAVPQEQLPRLHCCITSIILGLYRERSSPTLGVVQQRLRQRSWEEALVRELLHICAYRPDRYIIWASCDPTSDENRLKDPIFCLFLAEEPPMGEELLPAESAGELPDSFWNIFAEQVNKRMERERGAAEKQQQQGPPQSRGLSPPASPIEPLQARRGIEAEHPCFFQVPESQLAHDTKKHTSERRKEPSASAGALALQLYAQGVTTIMLRNLPPQVTQKCLLSELKESGFEGLYDFCYMPSSFGTGTGKGYAFVNLINSAVLFPFVAEWHASRRFGLGSLEATVNVSAAALQGLEENARRWDAPRMRRVRNPALKPHILPLQ